MLAKSGNTAGRLMNRQHPLDIIFRTPALSPHVVTGRRREIAARVMDASAELRQPDFTAIRRNDLYELLRGYDEFFFGNRLQRDVESGASRLQFRLSSRMTSTGGLTSFHQQSVAGRSVACFEIAISSTLLFGTDFSDQLIRVAGVIVHDRLDALQRIFEHELIHLAEMRLWGDSSCTRSRFRGAVRNLFGHMESNHQLISPADKARRELSLSVGDRVAFAYRGQSLQGTINRINRRATILVEQAGGELYEDGRRYTRFYMPLSDLVPAKH